MNQTQISDFLKTALDDGFDVQAILNQVMTIRTGEARVIAQNHEWEINSKYIFGVKTEDECLDPSYWGGFCINIVKEDYWKQNRCVDDQHITRHIFLPDGFGEAMEGAFDYDGDTFRCEPTRENVIKLLTAVGFVHSQDLQDWMLDHDP